MLKKTCTRKSPKSLHQKSDASSCTFLLQVLRHIDGPTGGAYSAPPDLLAGFGGGEQGRGNGKKAEGKREEGREIRGKIASLALGG